MTQLERSHAQHLLEVSSRHRREMDSETERLRATQLQAERALETREKAHRQRVTVLEEQVLNGSDKRGGRLLQVMLLLVGSRWLDISAVIGCILIPLILFPLSPPPLQNVSEKQ